MFYCILPGVLHYMQGQQAFTVCGHAMLVQTFPVITQSIISRVPLVDNQWFANKVEVWDISKDFKMFWLRFTHSNWCAGGMHACSIMFNRSCYYKALLNRTSNRPAGHCHLSWLINIFQQLARIHYWLPDFDVIAFYRWKMYHMCAMGQRMITLRVW